jgi:hypothetical protein
VAARHIWNSSPLRRRSVWRMCSSASSPGRLYSTLHLAHTSRALVDQKGVRGFHAVPAPVQHERRGKGADALDRWPKLMRALEQAKRIHTAGQGAPGKMRPPPTRPAGQSKPDFDPPPGGAFRGGRAPDAATRAETYLARRCPPEGHRSRPVVAGEIAVPRRPTHPAPRAPVAPRLVSTRSRRERSGCPAR